MEDKTLTSICYGDTLLTVKVDDCIIFGDRNAIRNIMEKLIEQQQKTSQSSGSIELINKNDAINAIVSATQYNRDEIKDLCNKSIADEQGWIGGINEAINIVEKMEPHKNISDVVEHDAIVTMDGYRIHHSEYICSICKKKVISGDDYCSHCGAELNWRKL